MCGIVGYIGKRRARDVVLESLKRLEYRGYDSAGIALIRDNIRIYKKKGEIDRLIPMVPKNDTTMAIGHTRWATHGAPSDANAHPHLDCTGRIAIVHNGIVENFKKLKNALLDEGHQFRSETDSEVIVHLVEKYYDGHLVEAMIKAIGEIEGYFAILAISRDEDCIVGTRRDNPLILGVGSEEMMAASDIPAILPVTNKVVYLGDNQVVCLTRNGFQIFDLDGGEVESEITTVDMRPEEAEKGGYEHFMLKEIFETPSAIHKAMRGRFPPSDEFQPFSIAERIKFIACGTSYHAAMTGAYAIEALTGIPTTVVYASEYRYMRDPDHSDEVVVAISQSGETADTLAAARQARALGKAVVAITNVMGSSLTRMADHVILMRAGPEISVAATKSYDSQLILLYLLALNLAHMRGEETEHMRKIADEIRMIPRKVQSILDSHHDVVEASEMMARAQSSFFIGRYINYPTALEGALKLKEISYIHAEGYPAGELKHGPLALMCSDTPVVAIAPRDHTYSKILSNVGEIIARGAPTIAVVEEGDSELNHMVDHIIFTPPTHPLLSPITIVTKLQLLAYHTARILRRPIDKPRNLAKSVTVE